MSADFREKYFWIAFTDHRVHKKTVEQDSRERLGKSANPALVLKKLFGVRMHWQNEQSLFDEQTQY